MNNEQLTKGKTNSTADEPSQNASDADEPRDNDSSPKKNSRSRRYILFGLLGIIIIGGLIYGWNWYQFAVDHESTDNAQVEGHISPVIPRVDGYVNEILVDDNDRVEKGDLLVTIDKDNFNLGVNQAEADLAGAKAAFEDAQARLATAKAQEQQAQVALNQDQTEQERQQRLLNDQSTTQQQFDNAKYALQESEAKHKVAQRQVKAAQVQVKQANTNIEKAQTGLDNADLQLSYTEVRAPIAGRVSKKNIEAGQYIRPGNPVMAIADDDEVWVVANFKEGQIAQIRKDQPVDVEVDAYSDTTFRGHVQSIGGATGSKFALLPPDNASGNFVKVEQRIPVKIIFDDVQGLDKPLKPGMNAIPTVNVSEQGNG